MDDQQTAQTIQAPLMENPHYVCTGGCNFVSQTPRKCPTPGCWRARNPLTLCECTDGLHGDLPTRNVPK